MEKHSRIDRLAMRLSKRCGMLTPNRRMSLIRPANP
jgi:hypothetical protein